MPASSSTAVRPYAKIDKRAVKAVDAYFRTNPTWKSPEETVAIRNLLARALASVYRVKKAPSVVASSTTSAVRTTSGSLPPYVYTKPGCSNIRFFTLLGEALGRKDAKRWAHGIFKATRPDLYASKVRSGS